MKLVGNEYFMRLRFDNPIDFVTFCYALYFMQCMSNLQIYDWIIHMTWQLIQLACQIGNQIEAELFIFRIRANYNLSVCGLTEI